MKNKAIVISYYGFPSSKKDIPDYLRHILHGADPPPSLIKENLRKLEVIGGESPSTSIVESIKRKLQKRLEDLNINVYVLSKHGRPNLSEASRIIKERTIYEVPLFPVYSKQIFDSYFVPFEENMRDRKNIRIINLGFDQHIISHFSRYIDRNDRYFLVFSAHSIPLKGYDPYPLGVRRLSDMISGMRRYTIVYHSQGHFPSRWLGPIPEYALDLAEKLGYSGIKVIPVGFLYDHVEVLYDLDYDFKNFITSRGVSYERVPLPNDSDCIIDAILERVAEKEPQ